LDFDVDSLGFPLNRQDAQRTQVKGKNADMFLLEGNPFGNLESISKVSGVFINQKFYLKEEIVKMMK
jgi:hypothetical protein